MRSRNERRTELTISESSVVPPVHPEFNRAFVVGLIANAGMPLVVLKTGRRARPISSALLRKIGSFVSEYAERRPPKYRMMASKNGTKTSEPWVKSIVDTCCFACSYWRVRFMRTIVSIESTIDTPHPLKLKKCFNC